MVNGWVGCANVVGAVSRSGKSSVKNCKNAVKSKLTHYGMGNCPTFVADAGLLGIKWS